MNKAPDTVNIQLTYLHMYNTAKWMSMVDHYLHLVPK